MKNLSTILLLALITCASQSNSQLLKSYGIKAAITSSSQRFSYSNPSWPGYGPDVKKRIGFGIAFYAEWLNVPVISIVSQIEYAQRGMGEEITVSNSPSLTAIHTEVLDKRLDYFSIPILAKASVPFGNVTPYILIGPRVDILLGYHDELIVGTSIYQDFKKTMFGGTVGAGFSLSDILPVNISLEGRYNFDFDDSYDKSILKIRNSAYDIWVGITL